MSATEAQVWRITRWCEARQLNPSTWLPFATWYVDHVTTMGRQLPFYSAWLLWSGETV